MPPFKDKGQGRFRPCPRIWRSGRDSNPRVVAHKLISSFVYRMPFVLPQGQNRPFCPAHFDHTTQISGASAHKTAWVQVKV